MILRKPYAFLIKHFKFIHFIMMSLMIFLIYQTNVLLSFFNEFISSQQTIIGSNVIEVLFNGYAYLVAIAVTLIAIIILILMSFKNKPRLFYVLTMLGYILLMILYAYTVSTIGQMQVSLLDERITRAVRDFLNIAFMFQIYTTFICLIRIIGLDVKKFEFNHDIDIDATDNEEFEINVEFDSQNLKRKIRRSLRDLKYYFLENKLIIIFISLIFILIFGFITLKVILNKSVVYQTGDAVMTQDYNITVTDSYFTNKNYRLNNIVSDDKTLVVIKFNIKTINQTSKFIYGKLALQLGEEKYYHDSKYSSQLDDLGDTYINQNLTSNYNEFLLVYEIPAKLKNEKFNLVYTEQLVNGWFNNNNKVVININPREIDGAKEAVSVDLGKNYIIADDILNNYGLKINNFALASMFKINYQTCVTVGECYWFDEIIQPTLSGISDKAILKLDMTLSIPEEAKFSSFIDLIKKFGSIEYEIDGNKKNILITNSINTVHNDGNYYFEIRDEVLEADKVSLAIRVRNNNYIFLLK